ncbi:MAG TPA: PadR family transcriptional regulator, partial [Candidatus Acidoferrum sp.]|nr:PadR family transcriptional regulator [Candidatus Acidoferrum sp.]
MELTNTAHAILGLLDEGPRSGYDIKQAADHSVRYFWAVGYGQIYPELRKLAKAGLVEREGVARGARERQPYRLTTEGRKMLRAWVETGIP